jgi:hypothetical protein
MSTSVHLTLFTLLVIVSLALLIYLATRSGRGYSVEDTRANAENFAGEIDEGRGGMTAFCWVTIGAIFIWSVVYFIMHWNEFYSVFFAPK